MYLLNACRGKGEAGVFRLASFFCGFLVISQCLQFLSACHTWIYIFKKYTKKKKVSIYVYISISVYPTSRGNAQLWLYLVSVRLRLRRARRSTKPKGSACCCAACGYDILNAFLNLVIKKKIIIYYCIYLPKHSHM